MTRISNKISFVTKLDDILKSDKYDLIIKEDQKISGLLILNKQRLQSQILPLYFRHSNISSFMRQLNLYGFKRVKAAAHLQFTHPDLKNGKKIRQLCSKASLQTIREPQITSRNIVQRPEQQIDLLPERNPEQNIMVQNRKQFQFDSLPQYFEPVYFYFVYDPYQNHFYNYQENQGRIMN